MKGENKMTEKNIVIHKSIREGNIFECCSECFFWNKNSSVINRNTRGFIKGGKVFKECGKIGHLAFSSCVCDFFERKEETK